MSESSSSSSSLAVEQEEIPDDITEYYDFDPCINTINQPHPEGVGVNFDVPADTQTLNLTNNRLSTLSNIQHITCLRKLVLRHNQIENLDAEVLKTLSTLVTLDLYENKLTNVVVLNNQFPILRFLDLSFNPIRKLTTFEGFPELKRLYFVDCKLSLVQGLQNLPKLTMLELGSNRLRTISGIESLTNLTELWIGRNKISTIENLDTLVNLQRLSLQRNRIVDIQGLDHLVNLQELYLSENGIQEIKNLGCLKRLKILDLAINRLANITGIEELETLEEFWVNSNQIESFEALEPLKSLKNLKCLYLEHNPLARDLQYRNKVLDIVPHLTQLDAIVITNRQSNPILKSRLLPSNGN